MDTMQLGREIWENLNDQIDLDNKIPFGDFVTHSDRILKQVEINRERSFKEIALDLSIHLYDELDKIFNFHSVMDFTVKNIFLPVFANVIENFITLNFDSN